MSDFFGIDGNRLHPRSVPPAAEAMVAPRLMPPLLIFRQRELVAANMKLRRQRNAAVARRGNRGRYGSAPDRNPLWRKPEVRFSGPRIPDRNTLISVRVTGRNWRPASNRSTTPPWSAAACCLPSKRLEAHSSPFQQCVLPTGIFLGISLVNPLTRGDLHAARAMDAGPIIVDNRRMAP